ncbi:MAG: hypothetical protein K1X57_08125 [Gemmataceae bacterium]|nr:hypothetical protein [Gemmataceae bacterium]
MRKIGIALLCLFPWLVVALASLQVMGCSSKPNSLETRIAFFNKHRPVFDSYVERLERGEVRHDEQRCFLPQLFIDNDVKEVIRRADCVEIYFWFMPTDAVPLYIYSPRGLEGVPEEYRNGGHPGGAKWGYWKFVTIDDKWFYCEWDT